MLIFVISSLLTDKGSAASTDFRVQKLLWTAAAMNNCINPLLYRMSFNGRWEGSIKGVIREYLGESFCNNIEVYCGNI